MTFHSQWGEDRWIVEHLTLPDRGVFIEVGGADGLDLSNTLHFERKGWTGLVVEPDPRQHEALRRNRRCIVETCAVDAAAGTRAFTIDSAVPAWSGFLRDGTDRVDVPCRTLAELVDEHDLYGCDLLSIDTEGTELTVWASRPRRWQPPVLIVEHFTIGIESNEERVRRQFEDDGYRVAHRTEGNFVFVRKDA